MISEAHRHATHRSFGPRELAAIFFRHKKKAALFSLLVLSLATLVLFFAPRKYRSESRLFLQVGRESVRLDPTATTGETIALQQSGRDNEIATAIEVLKSRAIIEKVVDKLTPEVVLGETGPGQGEPNAVADAVLAPARYAVDAIKSIDPISKREEAIIEVTRNFAVDAEFDSTVIVLTYDGKTPKLSQQLMAALVDVFRDEYVELHRTLGSKSFFADQQAELRNQLADAETSVRDAKNRIGVTSIDARRTTIETRLQSVELSRNTTLQMISATEARVAALKQRTSEMPERMLASTRVMPNSRADSMRSQLYALEVELLNLEAKHTADHPLVAAKRAQVKEAQQMVGDESPSREETLDSLNENQQALFLDLDKAQSELAGLQAQLAELDVQHAAAVTDLKRLNDQELELDQLERAVTLADANYRRSSEALEQARLNEELDNENINSVNVAQAATLQEKPVSPSKLIILALSLGLLTAGTTALVLACEKFDSRLRQEEQIENLLQIPVIASVPERRAYSTMPAGLR